MSDLNLTRKRAKELITPVLDGETTEDETIAFFAFIKKNSDVKKLYLSEKRTKELVQSRLPKAKAPLHLRKNIHKFLESQGEFKGSASAPRTDIDLPRSIRKEAKRSGAQNQSDSQNEGRIPNWRIFSAAASVILIVVLTIFFYQRLHPGFSNIDEHIYQQFIAHKGSLITPTIGTDNVDEAELSLAKDYKFSMDIPLLDGANFKGIVYDDFAPNFKTPLLEYQLSATDDNIYIYAFKMDDIKRNKQFVRNAAAVKTCIAPNKYHIQEINGKHIVSWKWGDVWYSAISNHDGHELTSMIKTFTEQAE